MDLISIVFNSIDFFIFFCYNVHNKVQLNFINMNVKEVISISEARKKIFQIADDVQKASNYYMLTENGKAKVVMLSFDDFDAWLETMEVIKTFPDIFDDIKNLKKDIKTKRYTKYTSLEEILKKEGYLDNKIKVKHAIPNKINAKSRKRSI